MIDRLSQSMQVLQRLMKAQEMTANNMANLNTPGFKADKLFYHSFKEMVNGEEVSKVVPRQTINMEQGNFEATGNPYDLAIEGKGFFKVELDGVELLTRNGRFHPDSDGFLVNDQGASLMGSGGPVMIPNFEQTGNAENDYRLEISSDGSILLNDKVHDKIELATVEKIETLQRHSSGYFMVPDGVELIIDEDSIVRQGFYEAGNVNPLKELTEMMTNATLFESQQKVITTTDELLSRATNSLGKF